ncbi:NAD-dependent succinate-semialdehyde dehydrogenase [Weeksellaceae bacterium KMM 9724]|uniref:NAD-dependent succinate-semialdehyde dehydrogenase n=1 Tax=Profundicola chukchiensis TaxID=2961959 RepID=UPI002437E117|nr:NAD-dependent succinate-semialdehyde dehydrogenase [Profundicola chukchiensis]MDG4951202.1 NAD-dependent succinate-semialdehyde dehydrogenase [Profundicola chukchiensis]
MKSINPYNQEVVFEHKEFTVKQVEEAIDKSQNAFKEWRKTSFEERAKLFFALADVLEKNKAKYAEVMTLEIGKPISQGIAEIEKCAWVCKYYAENAEKQLSANKVSTDAQESYVRFDPLGVLLAVMPWNFPFWQVFRFAVPSLSAGNTGLLKHASNVMESAKMIEQSFIEAGFPKDVFQSLIIKSDKVEKIIRNPIVKAVSLTGSNAAGAAVAKVASEEIKPSLLELGGNNALVVFEDCDLEATLNTCVHARFQNTGQSCIAGKRLFVHKNIADEFIEKITQKIVALKSGDPLDEETYIGTMVNKEAAETLNEQLQDAIEKGAEVVIGGNYNQAYFEPTLVKNVTPDMKIYKEETFGPLLACSTFESEDEMLEMVNSSDYGLGVSLFTTNKKRVENLIPLFEDGAVFVNDLVKSDPRLPFGGTKISGYGRELSEEGIKAFVNKKTVYIKGL